MNSCVLMAQIVQQPQLRYTSDNREITDMMVQFPGPRDTDPPAMLKVVAWGNLAKELQQNYHEGDQVMIVGRLSMNTIERPEGFKEKRAELTLQQIQGVGGSGFVSTSSPMPQSTPAASNPAPSYPTEKAASSSYEPSFSTPSPVATKADTYSPEEFEEPLPQTTKFNTSNYPVANNDNQDMDDIPF